MLFHQCQAAWRSDLCEAPKGSSFTLASSPIHTVLELPVRYILPVWKNVPQSEREAILAWEEHVDLGAWSAAPGGLQSVVLPELLAASSLVHRGCTTPCHGRRCRRAKALISFPSTPLCLSPVSLSSPLISLSPSPSLVLLALSPLHSPPGLEGFGPALGMYFKCSGL